MGINRVSISGNLTRDSELRETSNGSSVLNFCVAVNERRKNNRTGEWEDVPNFIDCTAFGNRAQALAQYLTKGVKVAIAGRLHQSKWQDDRGNNRTKLEVWLDDCEFMSRRDGESRQAAKQQPRVYSSQSVYADEDIPF